MADFSSETLSVAAVLESSVDVDAEVIYSVNPVSTVAPHYSLRANRTSDSTWQYWMDTVVSLLNAPGGSGNYGAATLTIEAVI